MKYQILSGILVPFFGTSLGAAAALFMKKEITHYLQGVLSGLAAGVMTAASFWSLLAPALNWCESLDNWAFLPVSVGFLAGVGFLLLLGKTAPDADLNREGEERKKSGGQTKKLILAVTLHNIPEGLAVGIVYAGCLSGRTGVGFAGAFALAFGIAVQNIPEGAIVSLPLMAEGVPKSAAFRRGVLSGAVEPAAAFAALCAARMVDPIMPFFLAFAAGAMFHVVVSELVPEMNEARNPAEGAMAFSLGFVLMMTLDVAFG